MWDLFQLTAFSYLIILSESMSLEVYVKKLPFRHFVFMKVWSSVISNMHSDFSYLSWIKSYSAPKQVKNGFKKSKMGKMDPIRRTVTYDLKMIWHEKSECIFEIDVQTCRKTKFLSFSSSFSIIWKVLALNSSAQNYIFNDRYYFCLYLFFPFKTMYQNLRTCIFFM